jgi:inosine-uridine nucleoside N-ribohydrolase
VRRIALWTLVALPLLALLMFALPVKMWRTGERPVPPLALVKGGPAVAMPKRVWIDTDAACGHAADADADDCFALLLLLRAPGIDVIGISTIGGNASAEASEKIVRELAALAGRQPPVHRGGPAAPNGGDPPAHAALHAALAEGPLTIVALGPLTNVAAALRARPELAARVGRLVAVMGRRPGHLFHPAEGSGDGILFGHGPIFRDFNFDKDPAAAAEILARGLPITLIPYEAARSVMLTGANLDAIGANGGAAASVAQRARGWLRFWAEIVGRGGFYPFDALGAAYVLEPALFDCATVPAWVAQDRRLGGRLFGPEALLVGLESERAKKTRASGFVIYCPRVSAAVHDWLMARLSGR